MDFLENTNRSRYGLSDSEDKEQPSTSPQNFPPISGVDPYDGTPLEIAEILVSEANFPTCISALIKSLMISSLDESLTILNTTVSHMLQFLKFTKQLMPFWK